MQKFSLQSLRAPQGPHWPKTNCYGEGAPLWRVKCEGRKKAVWKSKFLRNSSLQTEIHKHSQRKQGGKGGRLWEGWLGGGKVGLAGAPYPSLTSPLLVVGPYTCLGLPHSPPPTHPSLDIFLKFLDQWTSLNKVFWAPGFFLDLWGF